MMYEFTDTIEPSPEMALPAEAMAINGEYIENQIKGYRTIYTLGREILAPEVTTYDTGVRAGAVYQGKRYPSREITVGYQLRCTSNREFRNAYTYLSYLLGFEEAKIIFADEADRYYTGTLYGVENIESGSNFVIGECVILCADPYKYSVGEIDAGFASDGTFSTWYRGTEPAHPKLVATMNSACTSLSWADSDGRTILVSGTFDSGDEVSIDCNTGKILVNNKERADIGSLGNAYEEFVLTRGLNKFTLLYTASKMPTTRMLWRETYI